MNVDEDRIREIIREELARALDNSPTQMIHATPYDDHPRPSLTPENYCRGWW